MAMKSPRTHRCFAVLAMCLLLLGTAAPALERLTCSMGCPTTIGIGSVEDCCTDEHEEHGSAFLPGDCCDVERTAPEHHAFITENASLHFDLFTHAVEQDARVIPPNTEAFPGYGLCTRPPPLLTAERLSLVSAFLI